MYCFEIVKVVPVVFACSVKPADREWLVQRG